MSKVTIGARALLYPLPAVLVGAIVDGKPNFSTYAYCGIVSSNPPMISVSLDHRHHTMRGIKQSFSFSVNIPSVDLVRETDHCGVVSGRDSDKIADCGFGIFYGKLRNIPMIKECPVNLECHTLHILNLCGFKMVIGQIEEVHITDSCLTDNEPDMTKIKPFLWATYPADEYWSFGEFIGKAHSIGKQIKEEHNATTPSGKR